MARTRAIKPEFWDDEKLAKLSRDSRLTFIGMWAVSDDYGVCKGNSVYLKNKIFPYDEIQVKQFEEWLAELKNFCVIIPFSHHDERFFYIKNFNKHQKIDHPSKTRNPEPPREITLGTRETFESVSQNTLDETETKYKQSLNRIETELTTSAASDEKTNRLLPKENEPSNTQPDMLSELPAKTRDALSESSLDKQKTAPPTNVREVDRSVGGNSKILVMGTSTTADYSDDSTPPGKEDATVNGEISTGCDPPKKTKTERKGEMYKDRVVEIVDYFNKTAGTCYKHDTPETVRCIVARLKRGFTVDDFKAVIDKKTAQWKDDPKMQAYLRPITLFSTKFESYLNELIGVGHGRFGNSKPTYVRETEKLKGKYADQVDEVIYTDS